MQQNDWKDIRWNEANELFNELVWQIKDLHEREMISLSQTVSIVSDRLASASLDY